MSFSHPQSDKFIRFLGSVRLAVPLLGAIAFILIAATFYESDVGSATVQRLVYKSHWFGAIMFLLALNLGVSTLSRYPWRGARKVGFAITHWGLIVLIAGSAAVIHLSTEGMLLVRTDSGANNQIRSEGDVLEVVAPDRSSQHANIFVKTDGSVYPKEFAGLSLMGYSDNTIQSVHFVPGGNADNLAVKLQLTSDRMGQTFDRWVAVAPASYRTVDMGPATLEIAQAQTESDLTSLLGPPQSTTGPMGSLRIGDRTWDVAEQLQQPIQLDSNTRVTVTQIWPDFRLDGNNQPTSESDQFRNPVLQLLVSQNQSEGTVQERWFVFAQGGFEPVRSGEAIDVEQAITFDAPRTTPNYFRVVASPDHQLFYAVYSSQGFQSGPLQPGDAIHPGWADMTITLAERIDQAQLQRHTVAVTPVAETTSASSAGDPALQVADATGTTAWLPWGTPTALDTPDGSYFASFGPKLLQLPFYVKLDDFIVERNEGSESVAMWTSNVTLFDPLTDTAVQRSVWMNHPTWFRGWKLAQASWNPGDLNQSTLQLKREPWWVTALTWLGSMMVVSGIATMFYGRAIAKRLKTLSVPERTAPERTAPERTASALTAPALTAPALTAPALAVSELVVSELAVPELAAKVLPSHDDVNDFISDEVNAQQPVPHS